jgi:hypothetical protein
MEPSFEKSPVTTAGSCSNVSIMVGTRNTPSRPRLAIQCATVAASNAGSTSDVCPRATPASV